jgi:hypothetical protein
MFKKFNPNYKYPVPVVDRQAELQAQQQQQDYNDGYPHVVVPPPPAVTTAGFANGKVIEPERDRVLILVR